MKRVHLIDSFSGLWAFTPDDCAVALCGRWTKQLTTDRETATCPRCIKRADAEALARADAQKKEV